jgi:hypothetical protein
MTPALSIVLLKPHLFYIVLSILRYCCFLSLVFSLTYISRPFDYFILLTIAANCVVLSLDAPNPAGDSTDLNRQLVRAFVAKLL